MRKIALLALVFITSSPAFGDVEFHNANPIADYEKNKREYATYLNGVMNGLFWANSFTSAMNNVTLFCLPENVSSSDIDYIGILDRYISVGDKVEKVKYIEMALVAALIEKFPCSK